MKKSYYSDQRLEIIILGAMRGAKSDTSKKIRNAVVEIFNEDKAISILYDKGVVDKPIISFPEEWQENQIEDGVFSKLDSADLIIVNITPKAGKVDPTPNVFYELGLIHALGIPYLIIIQEGFEVPFYMRNTRYYVVKNFGIRTLKSKLRDPLYTFIQETDPQLFSENIISRFYNGLPIIDISAAAGLATGYYMNFVRRILKDDGFISFYPDQIKHLIVIRPFNIFNTYQQDRGNLLNLLERNNYKLSFQKFDPIPTDKDNAIFFDHVDGIVLDLPRTIYPLKKSPRLLSLEQRINQNNRRISNNVRDAMLNQAADKLLDKIENIIQYHINMERDKVRRRLLHFSTMDEVPELIGKLLNE